MTAWLGALAYSLQIYFDFSGYSDMAIGLGRMFGFHFQENFNYPYIAGSVTEFWRRWHISLSSWFRDYVYIPMGGNRVGKKKWVLNLLTVWLLTGIWHGANWTFLVWGLLYFVVLVLEKTTNFTERLRGFSRVYAMIVVAMAWVVFRAANVTEAFAYLGRMVGIGASGFADERFFYYMSSGKIVLAASVICALPVYPYLKRKLEKREKAFEFADSLFSVGIFLLSLVITISATYNPFIYFNF